MEDYTGNIQKQWISNANHSQLAEKTVNQTTKKKPSQIQQKNQEMDNIHILQPTNTKNYNPFQTN